MPSIIEEERSPEAKAEHVHERRKSRFSSMKEKDNPIPEQDYNQSLGHPVKPSTLEKVAASENDGTEIGQMKLKRIDSNQSDLSERRFENPSLEKAPLATSMILLKKSDHSKLDYLNGQVSKLDERIEEIKRMRKRREQEILEQQTCIKQANLKLQRDESEIDKIRGEPKTILESNDIFELKREIARLMADNQYLKESNQAKDGQIRHMRQSLAEMTLARSVALERNELLLAQMKQLVSDSKVLDKQADVAFNPHKIATPHKHVIGIPHFAYQGETIESNRLMHEGSDMQSSILQSKAWRSTNADFSKLLKSQRQIKRSARKISSPTKLASSVQTKNQLADQIDPKAYKRSQELGGPELDGYTLWLANTDNMEFLHPSQKVKRSDRPRIN